MAKYYGIGGRRIGSVGNETYTYTSKKNIVKQKVIEVSDAKTIDQVLQRSRLQNASKAVKNITSSFLKGCFEFKRSKKRGKISDANTFVKVNKTRVSSLHKKFSTDKKIIGIGNFMVSQGSLISVPITKTNVTDGSTTYHAYGIQLGNDLSFTTSTATVAQVSTALKTKYPNIFSDGDIVNGYVVYNVGVSYQNNTREPLTLTSGYHVYNAKKNFIIDTTDSSTIASKGFYIYEGDKATSSDSHGMFFLHVYDPNFSATKNIPNFLFHDLNATIGYSGIFIARKGTKKINVSTSIANVNSGLNSLIVLIQENPINFGGFWQTITKILIAASYLANKAVEIIKDWPI